MRPLAGRVALITGASRGIGAGIALHMARQGATVALMGRSLVSLKQAAAHIAGETRITASTHAGDVSCEQDVERIIDEVIGTHGRIDSLINNAGVAEHVSFLKMTSDSWRRVLGVNLDGVFLMTQRAARHMCRADGGSIVNIASIDAYGSDGGQASYTASKAAVIGLTKVCATELAPHAIRVNSVSPGWVRTQMVEDILSPAELKHMCESFDRVPLRRMVEVEEVASVAAFLASSAASGITGIDVPVDGGTLANLYIYETLPGAATGPPT